jgi:hypothetical protein
VLVNNKDERIRIAVYDEDMIEDEMIGEETYPVSALLSQANFQINFKNKKAGDVTLHATLVKNDSKRRESMLNGGQSRNEAAGPG